MREAPATNATLCTAACCCRGSGSHWGCSGSMGGSNICASSSLAPRQRTRSSSSAVSSTSAGGTPRAHGWRGRHPRRRLAPKVQIRPSLVNKAVVLCPAAKETMRSDPSGRSCTGTAVSTLRQHEACEWHDREKTLKPRRAKTRCRTPSRALPQLPQPKTLPPSVRNNECAPQSRAAVSTGADTATAVTRKPVSPSTRVGRKARRTALPKPSRPSPPTPQLSALPSAVAKRECEVPAAISTTKMANRSARGSNTQLAGIPCPSRPPRPHPKLKQQPVTASNSVCRPPAATFATAMDTAGRSMARGVDTSLPLPRNPSRPSPELPIAYAAPSAQQKTTCCAPALSCRTCLRTCGGSGGPSHARAVPAASHTRAICVAAASCSAAALAFPSSATKKCALHRTDSATSRATICEACVRSALETLRSARHSPTSCTATQRSARIPRAMNWLDFAFLTQKHVVGPTVLNSADVVGQFILLHKMQISTSGPR